MQEGKTIDTGGFSGRQNKFEDGTKARWQKEQNYDRQRTIEQCYRDLGQ